MNLKKKKEIRKATFIKPQAIYCSNIELYKVHSYYKEWHISVASYPKELSHFSNLKWPLKNNRFGNVEDFIFEVLLKTKMIESKNSFVADILSWKFYSKDAHSCRHSKLVQIIKVWLSRIPKAKRNKKLKLFESVINSTRGNGFPDIISLSSKDNRVSVWEVKAPGDSIRKVQRDALRKLYDSFEWDINIVKVHIQTSDNLSILESRAIFKKEKNNIVNDFLNTKSGEKLNNFLLTKGIDEVKETFSRVKYLYPFEERTYYQKWQLWTPSLKNMIMLYRTQYELSSILIRYYFDRSKLSFEESQDLLSLTSKDIEEISLWAYSMGYYRWWIFQIILMPSHVKTKKSKQIEALLELGLTFNKKFKTWDDQKILNRIYKHYSNWNLKLLKKSYDEFIYIYWNKLRSY